MPFYTTPYRPQLANGEYVSDIVGYAGYTAMGDPVSDIIGEEFGYADIIDGINMGEVGRIGLFRRISRAAKTVARKTKNTVKKIPGVKEVAEAYRTYGSLITTPYRLAGGFVVGGLTGGAKGAARGFKKQAGATVREGKRFVRNPVVRYGTKGAALAFPALTPVAAGVEAANQVLAAIDKKDPVAAMFALTTVANTAVAAAGGDSEALRAIKTIKAVKDGAIGQVTDIAKKAIPNMNLPFGKASSITAAKLGARFNIPTGASKAAVKSAASNLVNKALQGHIPSQSIIKQTVAASKVGDPNAKKAALVLAATHRAVKANAFKRLPSRARKAARAAKGKSYTGAYIVDKTGHVSKGNFTAK